MPASSLLISALILLIVLFLDVVARWVERWRRSIARAASGQPPGEEHQCQTCSGIDPVSDPAYNMREIAKQSVLLEEHLTVPRKYCPDCCVKHLLHLHGLATEAMMLACNRVDSYPLLKEAPDFYQRCLDEWLAVVRASADPQPRLELADKLRVFRKRIIEVYYIQSQS
jgi:hypothetical protein